MSSKVSIIITAHNYADYLKKCLDSALNQTYDDYEVVAVDDGSTDETPEILEFYRSEYPDRLRTVRLEGLGLPSASNAGIEAADGKYIVRLDADDYFDENLVTVEAEFLDANPDVDLVYPDYYTISDDGEIIDHVRNMKINDEVKLLNRSPLAAGAMYRRSAWKAIGGYNESLDYQEDYDFWVRFINEYTVRNVNLPLMYYRQHGDNMSDNLSGRLDARRDVKSEFVESTLPGTVEDTEVLGIIPTRAETRFEAPATSGKGVTDPFAVHEISGNSLLSYTVNEALVTDRLDRVIVSTEDADIAEEAADAGAEVPSLREEELADRDVLLGDLMEYTLKKLSAEEGYEPDFVVLLQYVSPLKTADVIDEVVDTWMMFSVDSVITVEKNNKFLWQPGTFGLDPLFDERLLREKRESLYEENGAVYGFTPKVVREQGDVIGEHVGHVQMQPQRSIHIDSWFELQMCEMILQSENGLVPEYRSDLLSASR
jgi:CMP-N-acetylneuraminic acid synthetase